MEKDNPPRGTDSMTTDNVSSRPSKRGTPNKRWKPELDEFLILILVDQANKGLKCDKTFKKPMFAFAANAINARFGTDFTPESVENHYRTLKIRYLEIKKAKELSGAGWNDELKMITLDPVVCKLYVEAHLPAKAFIKIICGDDHATGSYASSIFDNFGVSVDLEDHNDREAPTAAANMVRPNDNTTQPLPSSISPPSSTSVRPARAKKRKRESNGAAISNLIDVVDKVADAIKNPTHWSEILYERVMELDGFPEELLEDVFDHLQGNESEARAFMVKKKTFKKAWVEKYHITTMS
ncbi:hypothetical protein J5N97_026776 [Dioscorea zingiberensis]|uniref:Myb/SANT-like domain-containing protein n=1 Tax=Dioscorea zingiberensis TaxID=325984 RepID=A0A9D5C3R5_9LILI|nr:hypothetical protein J5N97_026776 [Dioscorea zingiberensis]